MKLLRPTSSSTSKDSTQEPRSTSTTAPNLGKRLLVQPSKSFSSTTRSRSLRVPSPLAPGPSLCFDLESRPSAYWHDGQTTAEITAFGWKWSDEADVETLVLTRTGWFATDNGRTVDARTAYTRFRDLLCSADLVYGHNIRSFDCPLFQAGLLRLQLPPLTPLRTTDTLRDIPRRKDMSASLENLADMYGLDEDGKLHMSIVKWERANRLDPDGIERARARVRSDVLLQERLRNKLLELNLLGPPRTWRPR